MVRYQNHRVLTVNKAPSFSDKQQTTEGTHPHSPRKSHVNWERAREEPVVTNRRARAGYSRIICYITITVLGKNTLTQQTVIQEYLNCAYKRTVLTTVGKSEEI